VAPRAAVLFDFDGTLADTAADLAAALNQLRAQHAMNALPVGEVKPYAGTTGFDPDAWCIDCQYYKLRRAPKKRQPQDEYTY